MSKFAKFLIGLVLGAIIALGGVNWIQSQVAPMPTGKTVMVRWPSRSFKSAVNELGKMGVVRNPQVFSQYVKFNGDAKPVAEGTYEFQPGQTVEQIIASMNKPISQMVRIPEGWWIRRVAKRLADKQVCTEEEYIELANRPEEFKDLVKFKLPEGSLEGYLYPDTYELPPMLGARAVIERQLKAFESKVVKSLGEEGLNRAVVIGSMVELEAALDKERPMVAGVIENRTKKGMRLEIDATVLYALGEWKVLGPGVVRTVKSPYNTYLNAGLPPGPIGSPSKVSIEAALKPDTHNYLFYVAKPDRSHYFTPSYADHLAAIKKARGEWKAAEANK